MQHFDHTAIDHTAIDHTAIDHTAAGGHVAAGDHAADQDGGTPGAGGRRPLIATATSLGAAEVAQWQRAVRAEDSWAGATSLPDLAAHDTVPTLGAQLEALSRMLGTDGFPSATSFPAL